MKCIARHCLFAAVIVTSSLASASDNKIHTYDAVGMIAEINSYRKAHRAHETNIVISDILERYIPTGRPKEEVFLFLGNAGFEIRKSVNSDSTRYQETYTAQPRLEGPAFWYVLKVMMLLQDSTTIYLHVDNGIVVGVEGYVQLQHL